MKKLLALFLILTSCSQQDAEHNFMCEIVNDRGEGMKAYYKLTINFKDKFINLKSASSYEGMTGTTLNKYFIKNNDTISATYISLADYRNDFSFNRFSGIAYEQLNTIYPIKYQCKKVESLI